MSARVSARERGASSAEYIGTVVVAAILVGAVVLVISPQGAYVPDRPTRTSSHRSARSPRRVRSTTRPSPSASIDIGENAGLVRTVMSDGTVTLTATDGAMLGASGSVGADFEAGGGTD